jgi:hypothetical protein
MMHNDTELAVTRDRLAKLDRDTMPDRAPGVYAMVSMGGCELTS